MAAITANAVAGLWSATSSWAGGVVPTSVDTVTIPSGATITVDTITAACATLAGQSGGKLRASRSASSKLTVTGAVTHAAGFKLDYGSEADPITGVSAGILCLGYTVTANSAATEFRMWGDYKLPATEVLGGASSNTQEFAEDVSTWEIGDVVAFGPSSPNSGQTARAVSAVSGRFVTFSASVTTVAGQKAVNCTRNVYMRPTSNTSLARRVAYAANDAANSIEIGNVEFCGAEGNNATPAIGGMCIVGVAAVAPAAIKKLKNIVAHGIYSVIGSTVTAVSGLTIFGWSDCAAGPFEIDGLSVVAMPSQIALGVRRNASAKITNPAIIAAGTGNDSVHLSMGGGSSSLIAYAVKQQFQGGFFVGGMSFCNGIGGEVSVADADLDGMTRLYTNRLFQGPDAFTRCRIGQVIGNTNTTAPIIKTASLANPVSFKDCTMSADVCNRSGSGMSSTTSEDAVTVENRNNDSTLQERYTYGGQQVRDNSTTRRGTSSIRFDCWYTSNPLVYTSTVSVGAGETCLLLGSMRYTSAYGDTYRPSIALSGPGLTEQTVTCPIGADTWHDYSLSITNTNAYAVDVTITYTGKSNAGSTGAYCWFDGVYDNPWVTSVRHFGHLWRAAAPQVADPLITYTEAAALAVSGVAIDHVGHTITVTAAVTAQDIWHYAIADLCQTANLARDVHISSPDGISFATTYTVVLGSGGSISGRYSDANGSVVSASVTNIVPGSRILVKRTDTNVVMSNSIVSGTTFALNVQTASAIPISVRVRKASSSPYYQDWSTTGSIDPVGGFAVVANQQPDQ